MTQTEALRLALEAFGEIAWSNQTQWQSDRAKVAITAIKATLEAKDERPPFNDPAEYDDYDAAVRRNERKT